MIIIIIKMASFGKLFTFYPQKVLVYPVPAACLKYQLVWLFVPGLQYFLANAENLDRLKFKEVLN